MSERISLSMVERAGEAYHRACKAAGILSDADRVVVERGSRSNGIGWRLYVIPAGQTGRHEPPIGGSHVGMSASDAYDAITSRTRCIDDLVRLLTDAQRLRVSVGCTTCGAVNLPPIGHECPGRTSLPIGRLSVTL